MDDARGGVRTPNPLKQSCGEQVWVAGGGVGGSFPRVRLHSLSPLFAFACDTLCAAFQMSQEGAQVARNPCNSSLITFKCNYGCLAERKSRLARNPCNSSSPAQTTSLTRPSETWARRSRESRFAVFFTALQARIFSVASSRYFVND